MDEKRYWLDDPRNVKKVVWALVVVCLGLFFADAFYEKHGRAGDFFRPPQHPGKGKKESDRGQLSLFDEGLPD